VTSNEVNGDIICFVPLSPAQARHSCRDRQLLFFVKDLILLALKILFEVFLDEKSNQKNQGCIPLCYFTLNRLNEFKLVSLKQKFIFNAFSSVKLRSRNTRSFNN